LIRKLHNKGLNNLYSSLDIIGKTKYNNNDNYTLIVMQQYTTLHNPFGLQSTTHEGDENYIQNFSQKISEGEANWQICA
jgi:hypothetical protein